MLWEVDEDLDQCLNWTEFKLMFTRNILDATGLEPARMYNLTQFLIYDHNENGMVSVDETMNMLYARYGRATMEIKLKELFGALVYNALLLSSLLSYALPLSIGAFCLVIYASQLTIRYHSLYNRRGARGNWTRGRRNRLPQIRRRSAKGAEQCVLEDDEGQNHQEQRRLIEERWWWRGLVNCSLICMPSKAANNKRSDVDKPFFCDKLNKENDNDSNKCIE